MIFYPEIYFPKGILRKINIIAKDADKVKTSSLSSQSRQRHGGDQSEASGKTINSSHDVSFSS